MSSADLQIGKLYTINHPVLNEHRVFHFGDPVEDYTGTCVDWLANNQVFMLLEIIDIGYTFEHYRMRILTSNGSTGWLALTNNGKRHIIPASIE